MASILRALRRRILTPGIKETLFSTRGFQEKDPESRALLESVGKTFLTGYGYAAEARSVEGTQTCLEKVDDRFRGFAYEGAAMAYAMRAALKLGTRRDLAAFLAGPGHDHVYMAYIGVGWAMARLPRFRWPAVTAATGDRLLRWLVLDGYGFHQAYFHTSKYVREQYREPVFPWPADDRSGYGSHVVDQGIGRATWFAGGADPGRVADLLDAFPEARRPDLYGGAGLAATYAGGSGAPELRAFWDRAGAYRAQVAQGSAFAAEARVLAGLVTPQTELATGIFCGLSPQDAAEITRRTRPADAVDGEVPAFERWRRDIAAELMALGRV